MEKTFRFDSLPENRAGLAALPEAALTDPFAAAALTVAALCRYEADPAAAADMLNFLKGPQPLSTYETQFLRDRLAGKGYKPFSFFAGATVANSYTPTVPFTITVEDNPYSYTSDTYATLYVRSAGADSLRPIRLRNKPSTGQWFLLEVQCLSDIRLPAAEDPWA